ncbi:hypothetical protein [Methanosarcina lacustris]|uniref:hypothetical protein n=1 Tax=Methanosarcina lacustris TaxID=170861 RepID=UPI0018DECCC6|nr:hypothetical protein [Methanosarcina lacustris]
MRIRIVDSNFVKLECYSVAGTSQSRNPTSSRSDMERFNDASTVPTSQDGLTGILRALN